MFWTNKLLNSTQDATFHRWKTSKVGQGRRTRGKINCCAKLQRMLWVASYKQLIAQYLIVEWMQATSSYWLQLQKHDKSFTRTSYSQNLILIQRKGKFGTESVDDGDRTSSWLHNVVKQEVRSTTNNSCSPLVHFSTHFNLFKTDWLLEGQLYNNSRVRLSSHASNFAIFGGFTSWREVCSQKFESKMNWEFYVMSAAFGNRDHSWGHALSRDCGPARNFISNLLGQVRKLKKKS